MFSGINIAGNGLSSMKQMLEITSNNITNIETTRGSEEGPYRRQAGILGEVSKFDEMMGKEVGKGVEIKEIRADEAEKLVYNPEHPDAGENGYVAMPKIDLTAEMTNLMAYQRSYEANSSVFSSNKKMLDTELEIGR